MNNIHTDHFAMLVGVGTTAWQNWSLPVTVADVEATRQVLSDMDLCGFADDAKHMMVLTNSNSTRRLVLDGLTTLATEVSLVPTATVLVYFSGHGWLDRSNGKFYLLPHDVKPYDIPGSAISAEEFTQALRQINAKRLLVFLDTCHAAGMASAKDETVIEIPAQFVQTALPKGLVDELKQGTGRAVFSSSTGDQKSWVRPDGVMSIYTYHLVEALQGAGSQPGDTVVRLSNLVNYLSKAVPKSAMDLCHAEQTPFYDWSTEDFPVALFAAAKDCRPVAGKPWRANLLSGSQASKSLAMPMSLATITWCK